MLFLLKLKHLNIFFLHLKIKRKKLCLHRCKPFCQKKKKPAVLTCRDEKRSWHTQVYGYSVKKRKMRKSLFTKNSYPDNNTRGRCYFSTTILYHNLVSESILSPHRFYQPTKLPFILAVFFYHEVTYQENILQSPPNSSTTKEDSCLGGVSE